MDQTQTLRKWSIDDKQKIVEVRCSECKKVFIDRQSQNDCIILVGDYWIEQEKCFKCTSGFGTEYHDGSGFHDCDPTGSGNRICKDYPKDQWCSECIYLNKIFLNSNDNNK